MAGPTQFQHIHAATMVTAGIFMITRLNYLFDLAQTFKISLPL
jgi:NADH-quinone oxidoreductase subunit L